MYILFSPSEGKREGGSEAPIHSESFCFKELYDKRLEVLQKYDNFLKNASDEALGKLFGVKDYAKVANFKNNIFEEKTMKAIERYNGVAYDYLQYSALDKTAQKYIDENVIIFSNLFGPICAKDTIPLYKLKQNEKLEGFALERFYKENFSDALDTLLDEPFLDLRAGFYTKFYKPNSKYITLKFLKNGKVVSHWAKAYRGIVLKTMAEQNIKDIESFMQMEIEGLQSKEILTKGLHTEIIYTIHE